MSLAIQYHMKRKKMAKGGEAFPKRASNKETGHEKGVHAARLAMNEPGQSGAGYAVEAKDHKNAKEDHKVALAALKSMPNPKLPMAEGGEVCMHCGGSIDLPEADSEPNQFDYLETEDGEKAEDDLVSRVMKKRKQA